MFRNSFSNNIFKPVVKLHFTHSAAPLNATILGDNNAEYVCWMYLVGQTAVQFQTL